MAKAISNSNTTTIDRDNVTLARTRIASIAMIKVTKTVAKATAAPKSMALSEPMPVTRRAHAS
jgi:hypothetical protein